MVTLAASERSSSRRLCSAKAGLGLHITLMLVLITAGMTVAAPVSVASMVTTPILQRHLNAEREAAADRPRSEQDQVVVDGWPLYRTPRGQEAFNHAMATLQVTAGPAPAPTRFVGCANLACRLDLPRFGPDGWLPAGRLWLSPDEFIVIVRSPRLPSDRSYRRRSRRSMRFFVFHEFHNATRNTDVYDTISSHRGTVFTPFYLSKPQRDANGHIFATLVQVAPYDVVSRHAANFGNRGPGIEVAKNRGDALAPIQAKAGIVIASIVQRAVPHIRVVHHRGIEGLSLLHAYRRHRKVSTDKVVRLPFVRAWNNHLPLAKARLADLIDRPGQRPANPRVARLPLRPPAPRLVSTGWHRRVVDSIRVGEWLPQARRDHDPIGDLIRSLSAERAGSPIPYGR
jgi:hypothetical protein